MEPVEPAEPVEPVEPAEPAEPYIFCIKFVVPRYPSTTHPKAPSKRLD